MEEAKKGNLKMILITLFVFLMNVIFIGTTVYVATLGINILYPILAGLITVLGLGIFDILVIKHWVHYFKEKKKGSE